METGPLQPFLSADAPASPRGFDPARMLYWLLPCLIHAVVLAWLSVAVQTYFAPILIFPLLLGAVLGLAIVGVMWLCQMAARRGVLAGTLVSLGVLVIAQHYFAYRHARTAALEQIEALGDQERAGLEAAQFVIPELRGPRTFVEFLQRETKRGRPLLGGVVARGAGVWLTWVLDAVLAATASLAVVLSALRRPYCSRCQSWYRSVQSGSLAVDDENRWRQLHQAWPAAPKTRPGRASYRLVACRAGCAGVALELSWNAIGGGRSSSHRKRIWLTRPDEQRLRAWLDQVVGDVNTQDAQTPHRSGKAP